MNKKKKIIDENEYKMIRLKRRYAKWKEKQHLEELLESEEYLAEEPDYLDLERRW